MNTNCKKIILTGLAALGLMGETLHAATVQIEWSDPAKFRDIEAGTNTNQKRFEAQVVKELGEYFAAAAGSHLATDQTLRLNIEDLDLAGDVEYFFTHFDNRGIRVIRDVYIPSIKFTYELLDHNGATIQAGKENLKDIGFHYSGLNPVNNAPLDYEKRLIEYWFKETF